MQAPPKVDYLIITLEEILKFDDFLFGIWPYYLQYFSNLD
jgi:hypothetical protein